MEEEIRQAESHLSRVTLKDQNSESKPVCELSEDDQDIFTSLITNAKQLTTQGNIKDALDLYKQALKMFYNEKLERKILKMEAYLGESGESNDGVTRGSTPKQKTKSEETPEISEDNQEIYNQMIASARGLVDQGKIQDALELNREALKIYHTEKLAKKISRMEMYLKENGGGHVPSVEGQRHPLSSVSSQNQDTPKKVGNTEDKEIFDQLIQSAKKYTEQGKIKDALDLYKEALKINNNEKLAKRIAKMELYLKENGNQPEPSVKETVKQESPPTNKPEKIPSATPNKPVTEKDQERFNQLIETAKQCMDEGHIKDALDLYIEASKIYNSEKLTKKISKIEAYLKENEINQKKNEVKEENVKEDVSQTPKVKSKENDQERFNQLVTEAKQLLSDGKVKAALEMNKQALEIYHSEKLAKKISKMEQYLKEHGDGDEEGEEEDDNGMVHVGNGYFMYRELYEKLYDHQKEAVLWMWGLHKKKKGGILGDDMGLGKTIQIISFLSGLFDMDKVHSVLIVMPVSLIVNWEKEFQKWAPGIRVFAYYGSSKKEKERALSKVQRRGGVLLTSYGLVVTSSEVIGKQEGREFVWDYSILDEGHKIKNPTKTTKGVHAIPARNRIILTGTPIQNNLKELWALFDYVHQGSLLGTARTFKMEYDNPITRARERDATIGERKLGQEMAESLKKIIGPYFLRRTKAEVTEAKGGKKVTNEDEPGKDTCRYKHRMPSMMRKNDLIIWVFLTQTQQKIYEDFLSLDSVKELLMTKKSPLVALTVLKKITDHPRLLSTRAVAQLGLEDHGLDEDQLESEEAYQSAVNQINNVDDQILISESGKLIVLVELLDKLKEEGHRTLVFSQSRKLLDIIEKVISGRGHKVMRLDGTVTHLSERDQRMQKFQTDDRYSVFLLTTQVGGVGLTLTAADRVVIYDPSWNPATDAQAVDRAFRIGQDKNVVIYRMITCGTVEEKIYRRQIFKDSITRQTTGNTKNPYRYFTKQELKELFQLDNPRVSSTQQQLEQMHSGYRKTDESLDAHIAYLYSLDIFGISDHDLMFGQVKDNMDDIDEEYKEEESHLNGNDYIQARVQKAQELLKMESNLSQPMSHYPSSEGQSNRPRGPAEWNMPNAVPPVPHGGPDNVVDMTTTEDSDTDMVDLTESPQKATVQEHVPQNVQVKQENSFDLDTSNTIKTEPTSPNYNEESEIINIRSNISPSVITNGEIKSEPKSPESLTEMVENVEVKIENESRTVNDINEEVENESRHLNEGQSGLIVIDSDEEMENDENMDMSINRNDENRNVSINSADEIGEDRNISINNDDENDENRVISIQSNNNDQPKQHIFSDDVEMGTPSKTPLKNTHMNLAVDSPMKVDDEIIPSPKRTPLTSIENVTKGIGSAVKLFGGQISNTMSSLVNMVTPERQKTPAKSRRKSVCQSPWLAKTPKSGSKNVINEELLISPDACRPLVTTSRKLNIPFTSQALTEARMNSTIMSAFGNSPTPHRNHSVNSSKSSVSSHSDHGEQFVEDSPSSSRHSGSDLVEDSPIGRGNVSRSLDLSDSVVVDSMQNTPAVINNSTVINESYTDSTPKNPPKNVPNIDDSVVDQSEEDDDENQMDSPIASIKNKKRKAVIESSDDESENENVDESDKENIDESDKEDIDESLNDSENENVLESEGDESDGDHGKKFAKAKVKKRNFIDDESDAEDDDQVDDYDEDDSFINDDDDEEEEDEESEEDENEESEVEEDDFDSLSDRKKNQFTNYVRDGRSLYKSGKYNEALVNILQALEIFPHKEVQALAIKINKKIEG